MPHTRTSLSTKDDTAPTPPGEVREGGLKFQLPRGFAPRLEYAVSGHMGATGRSFGDYYTKLWI